MKITRLTTHFDPEFEINQLIKTILSLEEKNFIFLAESIWYELSFLELNEFKNY